MEHNLRYLTYTAEARNFKFDAHIHYTKSTVYNRKIRSCGPDISYVT